MTTTNVTTKGQVTVPVHLRTLLGLKAGDQVTFTAESGRVYLEKAVDASALFGVVKARKSATLEQMTQAAARGWQRHG